ncbi:putative Ig domain-containing protein, partial [bacterium]|nr:putative Ig domain-containing protein [bacterium]
MPHAQDPTHADTVRFALGKPIRWLTLSAEGKLQADPKFSEIGTHAVSLVLTDGQLKTPATLTLQVSRNPRPPEWKENLAAWKTRTREPFKASLANLVKDLDGLKLSFAKASGPVWVTVSPQGEVSGTPADTDAGAAKLTVTAANDLASAPATLDFQIEKKNYPPNVAKAIDYSVKERAPLEISLPALGAITDVDGEELVYSAEKLPTWLTLSPSGTLAGNVDFSRIGKHVFTVKARDKEQTVQTTATLTVVRDAQLPVWPETLPVLSGQTREAFKASAALARELDRQPLTYSKLEGPLWIAVSPKGEISGTPQDLDAGEHPLVVQAKNDGVASTARFNLKIIKKNYPPTLVTAAQMAAKERTQPAWDLNTNVSDLDQERLSFTATKLPGWLSLSAEGKLTGSPAYAQIGKHEFQVRASDKEAHVDFPVTVTIERWAQPPVWAQELPEFNWKTREPIQASTHSLVKDLDGIALKIEKISAPPWLNVSAKGELTGTAPDEAAGRQTLELRATNDGAFSVARFRVTVEKKNYPPKLVKPLELTVRERETTRLDLPTLGAVTDPDQERLTYTLQNAPAWLVLTPGGDLQTTPAFAHIGSHKLSVQVSDREANVVLPITLTVQRNPRGPQWKADALAFEIETREPFKANLAGWATDLDGKPFRYTLVQGPAWLKVSTTGEMSGLPSDADAGTPPITLAADNGDVASPKTLNLRVRVKNHPPIAHAEAWKLTCKERESCQWNLGAMPFAEDSDRDTLSVFLPGIPEWLTLTPTSSITARPQFKQIGQYSFPATVFDGKDKVEVKFSVQVERNPRPPVWKSQRLTLSSKAREAIAQSLQSAAQDLDALPLRFTKKSGPDWLIVAPNGTLSGNPGDEHVGKHAAVFVVANDLQQAEVQATFEVLYKNHPPQWTLNRLELGKVKAEEPFRGVVQAFAKDIDPGDKLVFEKVRGPAWVVVSPDGHIFGKPGKGHVGTQEVVVRALDSEKETVDVVARVEVEPERARPVPKNSEIRFPKAYAGELFIYDLDKEFGQPKLHYELISGPGWLKLRPTGEFAGIPETPGEFDLHFKVSNQRHTMEYKSRVHVVTP